VRLSEAGDEVKVEGEGFTATFSRGAGTLVSLIYGDREVLARDAEGPAGPVLQIHRAITSNDKAFGGGMGREWQRAGLNRVTREVRAFEASRPGETRVTIETLIAGSTPRGAGFNHATTWTVRGDGSIDMESRFEPFGELPPLPRIGVVMRLGGELEKLRWYGRGPWENYADRKQAADVNVWSGTVDEQTVPYPRPQETGNKEDVRWLALTGEDGKGLLVVAAPSLSESKRAPLAFSALHYTADDLDVALHTYELERRADVILSLDAKHSGLGNASCGPGVLPQYEVPAQPYRLRVSLRPCPAGTNLEIAQLARRYYRD
jgi:beta-galactosidase